MQSSDSGAECKDGICVSIKVEGAVQALKPATFVILVKTEKDISNLGISLYGDHTITILDVDKIPETAKIAYEDERSIDWWIDTKSGEEYKISGHVVLAKPTVSYGIFNYGLIAAAGHPSISRVTDSVTIYLDADGNQVDENQAKMELGTEFPIAPTPPPDLTIVPETPMPTVEWSTETPLPSPTLPAYP